jgi:hypothetical protein
MGSFWDLFTNDESNKGQEPPMPPPCAVQFDGDYVYWGLSDLPVKRATEHFLACGTIGSGKTTAIRLFLQSIAPRFQPGHPYPEQLIIFDAKGNILPLLDGMGISPDSEDVWILNPFDERGVKWNIGSAVNSPAMARSFANLVIPHEPNSTAPYFNNAARQILCWVAIALIHIRKDEWTLRDLINALESKERMSAVCQRLPHALAAVNKYIDDDNHFGAVFSTLETKIGELVEVAALWDSNSSKRSFSITDFLKRRGILVLGHDPVLSQSIAPINAILLKALTNEILREADTYLPRHWFVLDEFRAMQQVDCIRDLLNLGRSKGASVLLGIQSVEGIREIYQADAAEDILQACSNKMFLRAGGAVTAEWAEKHFNRIRQIETNISVAHGQGGQTTTTESHSLQERSLLLASEFLNLPQPEPGGPFRAINDIPCFQYTLINDWQFDNVLAMCRPPTKVPGVIRRDNPADQVLKRWGAEDELKFCNTTSPDTPLKDKKPKLTDKKSHLNRRQRR